MGVQHLFQERRAGPRVTAQKSQFPLRLELRAQFKPSLQHHSRDIFLHLRQLGLRGFHLRQYSVAAMVATTLWPGEMRAWLRRNFPGDPARRQVRTSPALGSSHPLRILIKKTRRDFFRLLQPTQLSASSRAWESNAIGLNFHPDAARVPPIAGLRPAGVAVRTRPPETPKRQRTHFSLHGALKMALGHLKAITRLNTDSSGLQERLYFASSKANGRFKEFIGQVIVMTQSMQTSQIHHDGRVVGARRLASSSNLILANVITAVQSHSGGLKYLRQWIAGDSRSFVHAATR